MNTIEPKAQNASKCLALLQIPILMPKFRNQVYRVIAKMIQKREGTIGQGRMILPNCITSGVRGMVCGNGHFTGYKPKENANPNGP